MNIHQDIFQASHSVPVVVQFYADWCGPCRTLKPVMQKLADAASGKWRYAIINVEQEPGLTAQYQIRSIPTVIMFHNEEAIARFQGSKPAHIIQNWLDNNLPEAHYDGQYGDIDRALRLGDVDQAKSSILNAVLEEYKDAPLLRLLQAIDAVGKNNKNARSALERLDRQGPLGMLVKKVRDLIDLDEDEQDVHTPTSSPWHTHTSDANQRVDIQALDINLLNALVHDGINAVRNQKGIADLQPHSILNSAALDQNNYQIKFDQLTHYQSEEKKATVRDRILSFGGHQFRAMGENVQYKGFPSRIYGNRREIITDSYQNTANELVKNWVQSPGHYKNLINPSYTYVGTAVGWNPENAALFATQVFGA